MKTDFPFPDKSEKLLTLSWVRKSTEAESESKVQSIICIMYASDDALCKFVRRFHKIGSFNVTNA